MMYFQIYNQNMFQTQERKCVLQDFGKTKVHQRVQLTLNMTDTPNISIVLTQLLKYIFWACLIFLYNIV